MGSRNNHRLYGLECALVLDTRLVSTIYISYLLSSTGQRTRKTTMKKRVHELMDEGSI